MNERARKATFDLASVVRLAHCGGQLELDATAMVRDEYTLQNLLATVLPQYARREVKLGDEDRIDFLVRCVTLPERIDVGVEVKVDGAPAAVMRQLHRYLSHDELAGIVLVTTKRSHRDIPDALHGKPVQVVWLRSGL